jgi:hypothetical protein
MDMSVQVPAKGGFVMAEAHGADGSITAIYASTSPDGKTEVTVDFMEAPGESEETDAEGEVLSAPDQCIDNFFALADYSTAPGLQPYKWYPADLPFRWTFNSNSNPGYLILDNTEQALKDSTGAWPKLYNFCDEPDNLSDAEFDTSYAGRSPNGHVDISDTLVCDPANQTDDFSRVGFGTLPNGKLAAACRWGNTNYNPVRLTEADFRMNKTHYNWWNTPSTCGGIRALVREVATHERGHNFGLADINEGLHANLTMSAQSNRWCAQPQYTLGYGDILGLRAIYDNP